MHRRIRKQARSPNMLKLILESYMVFPLTGQMTLLNSPDFFLQIDTTRPGPPESMIKTASFASVTYSKQWSAIIIIIIVVLLCKNTHLNSKKFLCQCLPNQTK